MQVEKNTGLVFDKRSFRQELKYNILDFWSGSMVNRRRGGYYGRIDHNNTIVEDADKGVILHARILWTFSAAYHLLGELPYLNEAKRAFRALQDFKDDSYGGVYWMLSSIGDPVETKKQIYAQAFTIYGLTEYYKITNDPTALEWSIELFELIELYSFDQQKNGYLEAFDREWNLLDDLRLSEKDDNEVKTMNTHLHVLEAYTNLFQVWKDEHLQKSLDKLTRLFYDQFLSLDGHFKLFFDEDWTLKSDEISYGHDIEAGWLLHEAALALDDPELIGQAEKHALQITEAALPFFDEDGGLFNAGMPSQITDKEKHWWPQAEALVGLINAYQISKASKFYVAAEKCWDFIQSHLIDFENGEWIWGIDANGAVMKEDKAGPWKCPYHNGRAMIELMKRL